MIEMVAEASTGRSPFAESVLVALTEHGLIRFEEPVRLASGALSREFIDAKRALAVGTRLAEACQALRLSAEQAGWSFDAVGGMTMGADPLAHGIAVLSGCAWFVVRKEPKGRGTNRWIEGANLGSSSRVVLLDDVVTTGGSLARAVDIVREETGCQVVGALALLDRGNQAGPALRRRGVEFRALLTYEDLGIQPVVAPEAV
jgi:orotate phosphoribosyltransferase